MCAAWLAAGPISSAAAEGNGLARTPPMGWNDWYSAYCTVSAQLVEQTAQAMVRDGLKAAGYDYVNIDDCWMAPSRDAAGNLVPDPTRFPNGIKAVADYVHSLGLKLGIYEDAGTTTCAHDPGSFGHEAQDAATFASWGVDYVKYDRCNIPYADFPGQTEEQVQQFLFARMSKALEATRRPIVFSMCNPDPGDDPWAWGASVSNLWRTTTDIQDNYGSMLANFEGTVGLYRDAGPGAWNDPDLLQIGNGGSTTIEYRSEFSLWAEMAAPLIASTNVASLSRAALSIYENRAVIGVDQDPLGQPGVPISSKDGLWVMTKKLSAGDRSVLLFNSTDIATTVATDAHAAGLPDASGYQLQNLWTGDVTGTSGVISAFIPAHGVAMFRVSPDPVKPAKGGRALAPQTVLSLTPATTFLDGRRTTMWESLADNGTTPIKALKLTLRAPAGWRVKRLGPVQPAKVVGGHRFTVRFSVTAPDGGPPLAVDELRATASFTTNGGPRVDSAALGEQVSSPVQLPLRTANSSARPASFGASGGALAISARGQGVSPQSGVPATDSYAAIYGPGAAAPSSVAQVTVTADRAGGASGGAGLIERDDMAAPAGSPAGIALYVSGSTIVMSWNADGGADVSQSYVVPSVFVRAPVSLRLVRNGSTYSGYYSTDGGAGWSPVLTVALAPSASTGNQDVGAFHASGLPTWRTTATFTGLQVW
jgi:alpha-galactosidase